MSDLPADLKALRTGIVEARDSAARRGAQQMAANPDGATTLLDAALGSQRRLDEIDSVLSQL